MFEVLTSLLITYMVYHLTISNGVSVVVIVGANVSVVIGFVVSPLLM